MKIQNDSNIATTELWPLIEFVTKRCKSSFMAHLVIEQRLDREFMDGYSWKREGTDPTAPSRVKLTFGAPRFPKSTLHRKSVGAVTVRSWQEEFVHVLAHELRHIDQYWGVQPPVHYEVDAERFAHGVLAEYRQQFDTYQSHDPLVHRTSTRQARRVRSKRSAGAGTRKAA